MSDDTGATMLTPPHMIVIDSEVFANTSRYEDLLSTHRSGLPRVELLYPSTMTLVDRLTADFWLGAATVGALALMSVVAPRFKYPSVEEIVSRATAPLTQVDTDSESITVYGFVPPKAHPLYDRGVLDTSCYVAYVELYLRMIGVDYHKKTMRPFVNPRGKLPVANVYGTAVDDSARIVQAIKARTGKNLDRNLTPDQKAKGRLITNTLNGSLYWSGLYNAFCTEAGRSRLYGMIEARLPVLLRSYIWAHIMRDMYESMWGQGVARYPPAEITAMAVEDLKTLEQIFGAGDYLFGSEPTSYDALLYAYLSMLEGDSGEIAEARDQCPKLKAFAARIKKRYLSLD